MGLLCLYTHFICYLGSGSRAGSIPARYVSPMAELLRLQRGRPVKRKGLAEKGEKRKGERILFHQVVGLQRFCPGSDTGTISSCWYRSGRICPPAWVYLLLPTIVSGLRKTKSRWLICVANVIFIVVAFFNIILPLVIWLGLMILAVAGKKDAEKIETTGVKITHSYREDG